MKVPQVINTVVAPLKRNSTTILTTTSITGVVTTAYLTGKAAVQANHVLTAHDIYDSSERDRKERIKTRVGLVWKLYIPAAASGAVTIGCIVGTSRIGNKRTAAAQAAFVLTERAYSEYRSKVIEEYGERKDQGIRDSIAADRVANNPPPAILVAGTSAGNILCCELHTGRYFVSDMETLRRAQNDLNERLLRHDQCTLDDWYHLIGLPGISTSGDLGWNSDKLLELEFTTVLTDDGRPCLAFNYNYVKPLYDLFYEEGSRFR